VNQSVQREIGDAPKVERRLNSSRLRFTNPGARQRAVGIIGARGRGTSSAIASVRTWAGDMHDD
jgi:hypothetical protein